MLVERSDLTEREGKESLVVRSIAKPLFFWLLDACQHVCAASIIRSVGPKLSRYLPT